MSAVRVLGSRSVRRFLYRSFCYVAIALGAVMFSFPFLWMVRTTIMPTYQLWFFPPQWIPERIELESFKAAFQLVGHRGESIVGAGLPLWLWNSLYIAALTALGAMCSSAVVGFGFARLRFPGRDALFMVLLATMILPGHVRLVPTYYLFSKLGWVGSYKPLIVPSWLAPAFSVFLLRQFFMTIPKELDDAAIIDGCNPLHLFLRIHFPLSLPAIGVAGIFAFTGSWNNFIGPLLYVRDPERFPVSVGLQILKWQWNYYEYDVQRLMAATIVSILPTLIIFFFAQRYFVQGIVITGVKG